MISISSCSASTYDHKLPKQSPITNQYEREQSSEQVIHHGQYLKLFQNPSFLQFTNKLPLLIAVYNYPHHQYDFMNAAASQFSAGIDIMTSELTSKMLETCLRYKSQLHLLKFSACLKLPNTTQNEWLLLHTIILTSSVNGLPIQSCTVGTNVTNIKKDADSYYCCTLNIDEEVRLLYSKNLSTRQQSINFTKREIEIIRLICKGETTKQIAEKLFVSFDTIKKQRSNILDKTGVKNTAELVNFSTMTGLLNDHNLPL